MRTPWKRTAVGLLIAGAVGTAALGLAHPGSPPTFIPPAADPPAPLPEVVPAQALEVVKNDPAVALEWSGPATVRVNQPTEYTLTVRNVCGQSLQKVVVQVRAPKGTDITAVTPAAKPTDGVYLWDLGTLDARTSKAVEVTLQQPTRGEMGCQAWVTFTGTAALKVTANEPKLAVTIKAPEKVVLGDKYAVRFEAANAGDIPAAGVRVALAEGTGPGKEYVLKPGEKTDGLAEFTATTAGPLTYEAVATGADGLKASAKATVQVIAPKLDVAITGPGERLIGKKGTYTVTVSNPGEIPVSGVAVSETLPAGFKVCAAGDGKQSSDRLTWAAGDLAPGASKQFTFEGFTHTAGPLTHKVEAAGDRNTKASAECVTAVEGIPGLRMELVDTADPVEKGGELTYQITVTNTGTKADRDVVIACELPKELEFVSASGPTANTHLIENGLAKGGTPRRVQFDPISELPPKTEAVFKVKVKGTGTGDVRFKAVMTSKHLTAPVTKEESTRVYGE